jgi:hypothetical protein
MARIQVADGGDGLQAWKVATNILNKRIADKGWASSLEDLTWGHKNKLFKKYQKGPRTWTDY